MSRNIAFEFNNTLHGDWSAHNASNILSDSTIENLTSHSKWSALDPLVKVRLLLAPLFLKSKELEDLLPALQKLKQTADNDSDEWVRTIGAAVGPYDGVLHLDLVAEKSELVKKTLREVKPLIKKMDPSFYRPLEEKYLHTRLLPASWSELTSAQRQHSHFTPREPPAPPPSQTAATTSSKTESVGARPPPVRPVCPPPPIPGAAGGPRPLPRRPNVEESDLFMTSNRPKPPTGGGSLMKSGGLKGKVGGVAAMSKPKRVAAVIDVTTVTNLSRAAEEQRQQQLKEQQEAREAEQKAKIEAREKEKAREKAHKEALKEREAKEKREAKEQKERERLAEKERKEAEKAAKAEEQRLEKLKKEEEKKAKEEARRLKAQEREAAAKAAEEAKRNKKRQIGDQDDQGANDRVKKHPRTDTTTVNAGGHPVSLPAPTGTLDMLQTNALLATASNPQVNWGAMPITMHATQNQAPVRPQGHLAGFNRLLLAPQPPQPVRPTGTTTIVNLPPGTAVSLPLAMFPQIQVTQAVAPQPMNVEQTSSNDDKE